MKVKNNTLYYHLINDRLYKINLIKKKAWFWNRSYQKWSKSYKYWQSPKWLKIDIRETNLVPLV